VPDPLLPSAAVLRWSPALWEIWVAVSYDRGMSWFPIKRTAHALRAPACRPPTRVALVKVMRRQGATGARWELRRTDPMGGELVVQTGGQCHLPDNLPPAGGTDTEAWKQ